MNVRRVDNLPVTVIPFGRMTDPDPDHMLKSRAGCDSSRLTFSLSLLQVLCAYSDSNPTLLVTPLTSFTSSFIHGKIFLGRLQVILPRKTSDQW